jgi:hypothetical protein
MPLYHSSPKAFARKKEPFGCWIFTIMGAAGIENKFAVKRKQIPTKKTIFICLFTSPP